LLQALLHVSRSIIVTRSAHARATAPETLAAVVHGLGREAITSSTVAAALAQALDQAEETDLLCVAGSLFCVAEARLAWLERAGLPLPETDPV
jgi:folylpolyglutamate synthase/dihydropteroate synthase